jgi:hypothetical protein
MEHSKNMTRWEVGPADEFALPLAPDFLIAMAAGKPDGQISEFLSSPGAKNIPLVPSGKSGALVRASSPQRGVRTSRTRGGMRWTRAARFDETR